MMTDFNKLSGTIPTEFGRLSNLTYLDLSINNLHGTVPTSLAALENLGMFCFALVLFFSNFLIVLLTATIMLLPTCYVQKYFFYMATILLVI
jgi:hypothetical protein